MCMDVFLHACVQKYTRALEQQDYTKSSSFCSVNTFMCANGRNFFSIRNGGVRVCVCVCGGGGV